MVNQSRKYVDLMLGPSGGKYANWDPPKVVEVGDWGYIDKDTGGFVKEGNIFKDDECLNALGDVKERPIRQGSPEDVYRLTVNAVSTFGTEAAVTFPATPSVSKARTVCRGVAGEVGVKAEGSWRFTPENQGTILTANDVTTVYIESRAVLKKLADIPKLKRKAVVTETMNSPAYALLITQKGVGGEASLILQTAAAATDGVPENKFGGQWKCMTTSGVWRTAYGYRASGEGQQNAVYTLLFALQTTTRKRRGYRGGSVPPLPAAGEGEEFEGYQVPWKELDEDGEEILPDSEDEASSFCGSPN